MKARHRCRLQESSCGSDSVAESPRGATRARVSPQGHTQAHRGLAGPGWRRGPCPGARLSAGGVRGGTGPRPHASLSGNRLTSTPWEAFPVTSYDSITTSELKAKLFQEGKSKRALRLPPARRLNLGAEQWVGCGCRRSLSGAAVTRKCGRRQWGHAAHASDRLPRRGRPATEQRRPLSSCSVGASRDSSPPLL